LYVRGDHRDQRSSVDLGPTVIAGGERQVAGLLGVAQRAAPGAAAELAHERPRAVAAGRAGQEALAERRIGQRLPGQVGGGGAELLDPVGRQPHPRRAHHGRPRHQGVGFQAGGVGQLHRRPQQIQQRVVVLGHGQPAQAARAGHERRWRLVGQHRALIDPALDEHDVLFGERVALDRHAILAALAA
jgi:hypothetical protein